MAADPSRLSGDLPSISVRRPILAIVMNLMIIITGIAAMLGVEVRELPSIERPVVTVRADFPGAAPETMDAEVTRHLEGAAARVPGVHAIRAASEEGNARMYLTFDPSVDVNVAANDVREAVAEVERRLPDGVENVVVVKANDEAEPVVQLAAWSETLTNEQLTSLIEDRVQPTLLSVPGVADVRLNGNRQRTLNIVVDPARLASHRLAVDDIADALQSASLDVPAGSVESHEQNLLIRADATVVRESLIERVLIDDTTRIGDVASVFYGPAEATSHVRLNGRPVMGLSVVRQPQSNTIEISNGVERAVERLNAQLHDLEIVTVSDDAVFIRGAVTEVLVTLFFAIGVVILVILIFMGSPRITVIPAVTIPVALVGSVAAIWLLGFSINVLTLLALVLAAGLVVDDAIVVLENVERVKRQGVKPLAAAVLGTRQVFFAVIATTVTLASVFIPIAFLPGQAGQLFREFGFTLAISVVISSFVALSLCPMMSARLGTGGAAVAGPVRRVFAGLGNGMVSVYERSLSVLMQAPVLTLGLALALVGGVAGLFQSLDQELVPSEDRGAIIVTLQGPDGVNLLYSDRQVKQVEDMLQPLVDSGEAEHIYSIIGRWDLHRGYVTAPLAPWGERRRQQEIAAGLTPALNAIPGARASVRNPNSLSIRGGGGSGIEFAVTGSDYESIAEAADALIDAIEQRIPAIRAPVMEYSTTQPQVSVVIDRERAADLGVEIAGIASTLRAMVDGSEVAELNVEDDSVPVMIESRYGAINDSDDLRNLYVSTAGGRVVPLSSLVSLEESGAATELERQGQRRAIEVEATLDPDVPLARAVRDLESLAAEILPPGINLVLEGQAEALQETTREMLITFAIALVVVLLVLAAQFESFASALVIMVTVPFGLAAAVLALWLSGTSLNIYSQIGLVMLVGLMAKNGILIVEFANQLRDQGRTVAEAAQEAAVIRLRPVAMTMLSTSLAGVPLILSTGPGSEARGSIGWVIFGGLGFAILATLYITPVVYRLLAPLARSRGDFGRALDDQLERAPALDRSAADRRETTA